jgi:hypothetical protein
LLAAAGVARAAHNLLFETSASDPLVFAAVAAVFVVVGIIAAYLPARRAVRVLAGAARRARRSLDCVAIGVTGYAPDASFERNVVSVWPAMKRGSAKIRCCSGIVV